MKLLNSLLVLLLVFLIAGPLSAAGDFDWMKDFNIKAQLDPSGFRARLRARFKIGDAEIEAVLSNTKEPADAYMVFRLGEMSKRSTDYVVDRYKDNKAKGWGNLAKSLGIKPGSKEFHALKRGHDLYDDDVKGNGRNKNKHDKKGKSKK